MLFRHLTGFLRKHGRLPKGALERSLSTNLGEILPSKRQRPVIVTLDPNKFAEMKQQRINIGGLKAFEPYIMLYDQSTPVTPLIARRIIYDIASSSGTQKYLPYPPDIKAFLYYFTSPEKPRIGGELRFRIASSDDPASFKSGYDLSLINGQPWSRPLYVLSKFYDLLYEILRKDQLVPDDLDAILSTFPALSPRYRRRQVLYSLNDTFIVDFSINEPHLFVITEQGIKSLRIIGSFTEDRSARSTPPYTGKALVRFERSTLPDHKGTRTVVLRFVKIITPVECVIPLYNGNIVKPEEGELHRRSRGNNSVPQVWSVDIDKKGSTCMASGLQLLWHAT